MRRNPAPAPGPCASSSPVPAGPGSPQGPAVQLPPSRWIQNKQHFLGDLVLSQDSPTAVKFQRRHAGCAAARVSSPRSTQASGAPCVWLLGSQQLLHSREDLSHAPHKEARQSHRYDNISARNSLGNWVSPGFG